MSYGVAGFAEFGLAPSASVARQTRAPLSLGSAGGEVRAGGRAAGATSEEYAWEKAYERPWEAIEEDEVTGALITRGLGNCRRAQGVVIPKVQRGILRHVFLVLDMSRGMEATDFKPSRAAAVVALAKEFVREFFDQNPVSSLGIVVTRDASAAKVSELSGNPRRHVDAIDTACRATSGDMSLQASLELAARTLSLLPEYGTREVVVVHGALSTCDAGNIDDTIAMLVAARVRVSFVSLPGELYIATRIARESGGDYAVPETADSFRSALLAQCAPPPRAAADGDVRARLTLMGFPTLVVEQPGICACHGQLRPRGYICPRCESRSCELPTTCPICCLQLVSAPALARSYHHLFPVTAFDEVMAGTSSQPTQGSGVMPSSSSRKCDGCTMTLLPDEPLYMCPDCSAHYCDDCDVVIHDTLHNCPGCVGVM